jgi:hypothetical protein
MFSLKKLQIGEIRTQIYWGGFGASAPRHQAPAYISPVNCSQHWSIESTPAIPGVDKVRVHGEECPDPDARDSGRIPEGQRKAWHVDPGPPQSRLLNSFVPFVSQ